MQIQGELAWLLLLPLVVGCITWTVTKEDLFREWRMYCHRRCCEKHPLIVCKFFYVFTCEYCFSHYVAAVVVLVSGFRLLEPGWVGLMLAWFAIVWIANAYMTLYGLLRALLRWVHARAHTAEQHREHGSGDTPGPGEDMSGSVVS